MKENNMIKTDRLVLSVIGVIVMVLSFTAFTKSLQQTWKDYQATFRQMAVEKLGEQQASSIDKGIQQIWNPDLHVVDRCTTCHQAILVPGFENEENPYKTHPDLPLWNGSHPFKDYGCTICHGGQGYATKTDDAHGEMKHWETPMFSRKMAASYGMEMKDMMQINCNICHRNDEPDTAHMEDINLGKKIVAGKVRGMECQTCHVLDGRNGGSIGPELTFEGSKHGEHFDMTNVQNKENHTVFQWHYEHFKNPGMVSKGSAMAALTGAFTDEEAKALTILVMSWQKKNIPLRFAPNPNRVKSIKATDSEKSGDKSSLVDQVKAAIQ